MGGITYTMVCATAPASPPVTRLTCAVSILSLGSMGDGLDRQSGPFSSMYILVVSYE